MRFKSASAALLVGVMVVLAIPGASFAAADDTDLTEELRAVAPDLAAEIAPESTTSTTLDGVTATATADKITIASDAGAVSLTAKQPGEASSIESVLLNDASALFAIRLDNETAPRAYDFELQLPSDATIEELETGGYMYMNANGDRIGGTAPPWARDAEGRDVPTWFTLSEGVLTQHVDLDALNDVSYPVIADPYQGNWLVESAWVTNQGGSDYVVRAVPTTYGRYASGAAILSYHSADLRARLGSLAYRVIPTIENQFHCHVVYNSSGGGSTYDMESWRPDIWWWLQAAAGCNP